MPRRAVLTLALLGVACLVAASPAAAAETIGQTTTEQNCSNGVHLQAATVGGVSYKAGASGVIVSWSYRAGGAPAPSIKLKVYAATADPTKWFLRSESAQKAGGSAIVAGQLNNFTEKPGIRIEKNDVLGMTASGGTTVSCLETTNNGDVRREKNPPDTTVGQENTGFLGELPKSRIGVSAVIEPDADGDGFGDETQDGCPGDKDAQGPCPDADGDGVIDKQDACVNDSDVGAQRNPRTGCPTDADNDGAFDANDPDDDNDGILDADDKFPFDPSKYLADATAGPDTIDGTARDDTICGLAGNDILRGLAGNDTIYGDACNDVAKRIFGAQAGTDGNDTITGGDGDDKLFGAGGKDQLIGDQGKDKLVGGDGNDTLNGGAGKDSLDGGRGNDKLTGGADKDKLKAGDGNDSIKAKDGVKETVDCGAGKKDTATVDKNDKVKGCETVKRAKK